MIVCWNCEEDLNLGLPVQSCKQCGVYAHIIEDKSYKVPVLITDNKEPRIEEWNDNGINFLDEIQKQPMKFISTRIEILTELAGIKQQWRNKEQILDRISTFLESYGLEFFIYQKNLNILLEMKPRDLKSSPCGIRLLNSPELPIEIRNDPDQDSYKPPNPNEKKQDPSWIFEKLEEIYPDQNLRIEQKEAIEFSIENPGSLVSVVLPTGHGKTRITQSLAIYLASRNRELDLSYGPVVVFYPTISLMDDQKEEWDKILNSHLREAGLQELKIRVINSTEDKELVEDVGFDLINGNIDVLICSPESFVKKSGKISLYEIAMRLGGDVVKGMPFSGFIVDEAHITFDWGDSIRDSYLFLDKIELLLRRVNPNLRTILMTATLTKTEENILIDQYKRKDTLIKRIRKNTTRPDIAFTLLNKSEYTLEYSAQKIWQEYKSQIPRWYKAKSPLIIYTYKKDDCKKIRDALISKENLDKKMIEIYNGDTKGSKARKRILTKFQRNKIKVLIATSAFGMGVNKSDVWMIGYVGKPGTLRELYQAFGRAARGSNWMKNAGLKYNGNCIGILKRNLQNKEYSRTLGVDKTIERLLHCIEKGESTDNGFFLFDLNPGNHTFWNPFDYKHWSDEKRKDSAFKSSLDKECKKLGIDPETKKITHLARIEDLRREKYNQTLQSRRRNEYTYRRKALIYLDQSSAIDIVGIFDRKGMIYQGLGSIKEILEKRGINGLFSAYQKLGTGDSDYILRNSGLCVVAKVNRTISGLENLIDEVIKGQEQLTNLGTQNQNDLKKFLSKKSENTCIRVRFAPAVGAIEEETKTCEELFRANLEIPLHYEKAPVIPCSVCRSNIWPNSDPPWVHGSNLKFTSQPPYSTWLNDDALSYLAGRKVENENIFSKIETLPIEDFVINFSNVEENEDVENKKRSKAWTEMYNNFACDGDTTLYFQTYDTDGNERLEKSKIKFALDENNTVIHAKWEDFPDEGCTGLIFEYKRVLVCRMISINDYDLVKKILLANKEIGEKFLDPAADR